MYKFLNFYLISFLLISDVSYSQNIYQLYKEQTPQAQSKPNVTPQEQPKKQQLPTQETKSEEADDMAFPSTGTGFFVNSNGNFVTAAHVVNNCVSNSIRIRGFDKNTINARLLTLDKRNDLALLIVDKKNTVSLSLNLNPQLGEDIYVFGYPGYGILAQSGNFTAGIITSLSGLNDDATQLQISAPVNRGHSGGPVFDQKGNVVGIVLSKYQMNTSRTEIIQNANFAIRSRIVEIFLSSNGISSNIGNVNDPDLLKTKIATQAQSSAVLVYCDVVPPKKKS